VTARLALESIRKQYPAVLANDNVSLTVEPGEIHAVLGENGAGKSTLMKVIYGAVKADSGRISLDGQPVSITNPAQARSLGIAMVFQHFSLFETLTVAENVALGLKATESVAQVAARLNQTAKQYGLDIEPQRAVHSLSVGERQRVEILRALLANPKILILDEPTSVLTPQAVKSLFDTLRKLAQTGCSILYISHKLNEIRDLCHRCTVLREGKVVGVVDPRQTSEVELAKLMIGNMPPTLQRDKAKPGNIALAVHQLTLPKTDLFSTGLAGIHLQIRQGEILGIAGVSGNGQQSLLAALSGEDVRAEAGAIVLFGNDVSQAPPQSRRQLGLHFVPEERLGRGALPTMSLAENTVLTRAQDGLVKGGFLQPLKMAQLAKQIIQSFMVKADGAGALASSLSGGNLQKFIVGREVTANPKVFIVAQPTWGVDIGAAAQIRQSLIELRNQGCAVLVMSEELDELFEIADRLQVMAAGRLSPSVDVSNTSAEEVGRWMSGLWDE
jgi:general nucleoside transport system ATP-binding protein